MMLFEVFRSSFTAAVETLFGLNLTSVGAHLPDENICDLYVNTGGNPIAAAFAYGERYKLSRIDKATS
jgi:hypothetical protein